MYDSWELHAIDVCNPPGAGNIGIFNDAEGLYIGLRYTSRAMASKGGWLRVFSCSQSLQMGVTFGLRQLQDLAMKVLKFSPATSPGDVYINIAVMDAFCTLGVWYDVDESHLIATGFLYCWPRGCWFFT